MTDETPDLFEVFSQEPASKPQPCAEEVDPKRTAPGLTAPPERMPKRNSEKRSGSGNSAANTAYEEHYLTEQDLTRRYQVSRQTLWRWVNEGTFPAPVIFGKKTKRWSTSVVERHDSERTQYSRRSAVKTKSRRAEP